jgi:enterochelin esterase family protein
VLVVRDGDRWRSEGSLVGVVDRLAAAGGPRLLTVLVERDRPRAAHRRAGVRRTFVGFLADELVGWLSAGWGGGDGDGGRLDPSRVIIASQSLGGLTAAYAAWRRPDRFGNVIAQSGSLLLPTRRLRNVLVAKGYDVHHSEYSGGHDRACWHASIGRHLGVLTAGWRRTGRRRGRP